MERSPKETSATMRDRICTLFPADRYAVLFEVRNATGFSVKRRSGYCDALVMGLWPSRGLELWGLEIKVSRSDWLRELKQPEKAEEFLPYCHRWFIVAPADIIHPGELPPTWGHLAPIRNTLRAVSEAPLLQPKPADVGLLASICRAAADGWTKHPSYLAAIDAVEKQIATRVADRTRGERNKLESLADRIADFELASGVPIFDRYTLRDLIRARDTNADLREKLKRVDAEVGEDRYYRGTEKIGAAVRTVLDGGVESMRERLEKMIATARNVADSAERALAEFDSNRGAN